MKVSQALQMKSGFVNTVKASFLERGIPHTHPPTHTLILFIQKEYIVRGFPFIC